MDANRSITQQKKTRHGRMYVYMAEDIFRNKAAEEMFLPSSSVLVMYLVVKRFVSEVMFFLWSTWIRDNIGFIIKKIKKSVNFKKVDSNMSSVERWVWLLGPCENVFCQRDITLNKLVTTMLLLSFTKKPLVLICYKVLWEIYNPDFPEYPFLLPFIHDPM